MAHCQNFFDDKSPSICRSSSSGEHQQLSPSSTIVEGDVEAEDRNLDLRLGPSADASKPRFYEMVRPIPLYPSLDRQRSGSHGNPAGNPPLFRGQSDSLLGVKALFSKDSAFSTPLLASRDQVWRSLQSSDAVTGSRHSKAGGEELTSPLLCRRSASMHIVMPSNELCEAAARPSIRRSWSNSIPAGLLASQSSLGQEALVDESPDPANSASHYQRQDALELQKKKEIQAHRRLEARKRRRLFLEKQQKRARQCNVSNNKQAVSPAEKTLLCRSYSLDRKYTLEGRPRLEITASKIANGDDKMNNFHAQDADETMVQCVLHQSMDEKEDSLGLVGKRPENMSGSGSGIQGALSNVRQMIASCDLLAHSGTKENSPCEQGETNVESTNVSKMFPSSCSETDSIETKEKEMYASERESSSQKSPTGNHGCHRVSTGMASPSSNTRPCLQTSPGVSSVTSNVQMKSFQHCTPYLYTQKSSEKESIPVSKAPCHKVLDLVSEVPTSDYTIKRSVGVFSEGKWRVQDEDPNCLLIRRTTSNFHEAMLEPHCSTEKLETYASLSASQLKFAGKLSDNTANSLQSVQMQLRLRKLNPCEKEVRKHADAGRTDGTIRTHLTSPIKVKEEQEPMDGEISECCAALNPPLDAALKTESEPIKRQSSASFSELPCVTTTGSGPNGRTIHGVMYITSGRSVRLVCRCHGKHMSPAEFVEHAGSTDLSNPLRSIVVNCFPMVNHLSTPV